MTIHLAFNVYVMLALFGVVVGGFIALMGVVAGADPEGRGGILTVVLVPVGGAIAVVCAAYCVYRFLSLFGVWP